MTFKLDNEQVHFKVKDNKDNIKKALFLGLSLLANIRNQFRSFLLDRSPTRFFFLSKSTEAKGETQYQNTCIDDDV